MLGKNLNFIDKGSVNRTVATAAFHRNAGPGMGFVSCAQKGFRFATTSSLS